MAEEIRRSGRATKGQHNKLASSSPAPNPKPAAKAKTTTSKKSKAAAAAAAKSAPSPSADNDEDDEKIRCVCGNDDPEDNRTFISCDACLVWQHNVCMGITDEDDDTPEHYFCEECRPEEHQETLQAMARGEKIWETRLKIMKNEKKSRKRKSKGPPGWLKKEVLAPQEEEETKIQEAESGEEAVAEGAEGAGNAAAESAAPVEEAAESVETTGSKRKRDEVKEEADTVSYERVVIDAGFGAILTTRFLKPVQKTERTPSTVKQGDNQAQRSDKRRKAEPTEDPETALVEIDQLPTERRKVAESISKIVTADVQERVKGGYKMQKDQTPNSVGDHHAARIEYALQMNHGGQTKYSEQFRSIFSNLKRNKLLIERLLQGSLTADELSTMSSADMASEDLQRERAAMKAESDRLATLEGEVEGPRMRRTHKGDEVIEDENNTKFEDAPVAAPIRDREDGDNEVTGMSPPKDAPTPKTDTARPADPRRASDQQFNMSDIWAKTAQSPTQSTAQPRPLQQAPRRRSSIPVNKQQEDGTREDADVDRLLRDDDDDEPYSPKEDLDSNTLSYHSKIIASSTDVTPTISASFAAGRDVGAQAWRNLLPPGQLTIEGRLGVNKAEEYLCGLQWSSTSDVAVLALHPSNPGEQKAFDEVWEYFRSRERYAVVAREKPVLVKDCYLIPVEAGAGELPPHVEMLEQCLLSKPVGKRMFLATFVLARAGTVAEQQDGGKSAKSETGNTNGHLPPHLRASISAQGPSGSPMANTANSTAFPPAATTSTAPPFPPNPYTPLPAETQPPLPPTEQPQQPQQAYSPTITQILGPFLNTPTAQQIVAADPSIQPHKLQHLRNILERSVPARTEIRVLMEELGV
ncbi:hypothetical protein MBLNU230_g0715t1 [Neophaeotheca triangularis]